MPVALQSNWVTRKSVPAWVANANVQASSVDTLLAGFDAQQEQDKSIEGLVDDLFAEGLF
jgi:hypothetical protein